MFPPFKFYTPSHTDVIIYRVPDKGGNYPKKDESILDFLQYPDMEEKILFATFMHQRIM